jgi:hypothetical protein
MQRCISGGMPLHSSIERSVGIGGGTAPLPLPAPGIIDGIAAQIFAIRSQVSPGQIEVDADLASRPGQRVAEAPAGTTATTQTFGTETRRFSRVKSSREYAFAGNRWPAGVPGSAVSPPYMVSTSAVPSSCR